jgi:hypothetical protein
MKNLEMTFLNIPYIYNHFIYGEQFFFPQSQQFFHA